MKSFRKSIGEYLLLTFALIISSVVIFYKFTVIPQNFSFDEVDMVKIALLLNNSSYQVILNNPLAFGHSTFYFYIILGSIKLFGVNSFALRFPSAIFGILASGLLFLIVKKLSRNNTIAFLSVLICITMHWYFNFARFAFEVTLLLFLELACILFLFLFLESKKIFYLFVCALFAGLTFHSYYPGRIFFILPSIWIFFKAPKKYGVIFLLLVGIIISPLVWFNYFHPDVRFSQISFLTDPKISLHYKAQGIVSNIIKTALMPFWKGDMNGRHNFPGKAALNPILSVFFIAGIYIAFRKKTSFYTYFFLSYLLISVIPALLTSPHDNPTMLRTFTAIPSVVYFISLFLSDVLIYIGQQKYSHFLLMALLIAIFISTGYEMRTYFSFQARVFKNSFEVTCSLKDVVYKRRVPKSCLVQSNMF